MTREQVALELTQYLINLLNLIGKEVDQQFAKWSGLYTGFLDGYVAAHARAANSQEKVLAKYKEEQRRSMERSLFLMEILSIPAVSWLGAALEMRVGKRIFREYEDGVNLCGRYFYKVAHDEFKSKVFGDSIKDFANIITKLTGEKIVVDEPPEVDEHKIAFQPTLDLFGSTLYQEVEEQRAAVLNNVDAVTLDINKRLATFGNSIVKRLRSERAGFDRLTGELQFQAGTELIDRLVQESRKAWASSWLFYGSDPPAKPNWRMITDELERQLWCVWLVQQDLHAGKHGWNLFDEDYRVIGASGEVFDPVGGALLPPNPSLYENSPIQDRLFEDFNAPLMDYRLDHAVKTHTKAWAEKQVEKLKDWINQPQQSMDYLNQVLRGKPRKLQEIDSMFRTEGVASGG
jgi:hypothetical protein